MAGCTCFQPLCTGRESVSGAKVKSHSIGTCIYICYVYTQKDRYSSRIYICNYIHINVYTYIPSIHNKHKYTHLQACICVYLYMYTYIHAYIHTYVRMYVHTCIHTYMADIHIFMYAHTRAYRYLLYVSV